MKSTAIAIASLTLAACSSMPSWVPGSGWTTLKFRKVQIKPL